MVGLSGEKFTFFSTPLGQPNLQESQTNNNSLNYFELCFYFKYLRSYKVLYNLSDKTFETDFSSQSSIVCSFDYNSVNHKNYTKALINILGTLTKCS